jgi:Na+/proline symporter
VLPQATCCVVDIVPHAFGLHVPPERTVPLTRKLTVLFGLFSIGLAFGASAMASLIKATVSIFGLVEGPLLGLFAVGMLTKSVQAHAAATGLVVGLLLMLWLGVANTVCGDNMSVRTGGACRVLAPGGHLVSVFWFSTLGACVTFFVSLGYSRIIGKATTAAHDVECDDNSHAIADRLLASSGPAAPARADNRRGTDEYALAD